MHYVLKLSYELLLLESPFQHPLMLVFFCQALSKSNFLPP